MNEIGVFHWVDMQIGITHNFKIPPSIQPMRMVGFNNDLKCNEFEINGSE